MASNTIKTTVEALAWAEGFIAGVHRLPQSKNKYVGALAQEWIKGWHDGYASRLEADANG